MERGGTVNAKQGTFCPLSTWSCAHLLPTVSQSQNENCRGHITSKMSSSSRDKSDAKELRFSAKMETLFPNATRRAPCLKYASGHATIAPCALSLAFWSVPRFSL